MVASTADASAYYDDGYVEITWSHGSPADWYAWRVYRAPEGTTEWTLLEQITVQQANYTYRDYWAPANASLDYAVVLVTSTDGGQTVNEGSYDRQTVQTLSDKYWLLHPSDPALNVRLDHVTADNFSDETEESVLNVVGRGRKVDRGEDWGVSGELSVKFRDNASGTARDKLKDLIALKRAATYVHLRNPFGDVWKVALGGVPSIDREPGIGIREHTTVRLTYLEVA